MLYKLAVLLLAPSNRRKRVCILSFISYILNMKNVKKARTDPLFRNLC